MAVESEQTVVVGGSRRASSAESVAGTAVAGEKICCVCGADVAGKKRMKDGDGNYWCYDCGMEDTVRKHPEQAIECPECHEKFAPTKLVDFDGKRVCQTCEGKLAHAKKRADARIAAAEEEARRDAARKKQIMIGVGVVAVIIVLWIVASMMGSN